MPGRSRTLEETCCKDPQEDPQNQYEDPDPRHSILSCPAKPMEPTLPDLQALSQWDRQFCQFAAQQQLLKPKQLALA